MNESAKASGDVVMIFMADDDEDDCLLFVDVLQEASFKSNLKCFSNGSQLIDHMKNINNEANFPHLLFLDLNMPIKNGLDSLAEIRAYAAFSNIPIIVYSTSAQREAVETAFENGANLFVKKPDSFGKLKILLEKIMERYITSKLLKPDKSDFFIDL